MTDAQYRFFERNGYVSLGKILSDGELKHFNALFDRDRGNGHWYHIGHHQTVNCDALLTAPEFDGVVRHPAVMEALHRLMGPNPCFSEICLRHMGPYDKEFHQAWHRDGPRHWLEHPLRIGFLQLMLYFSDVDETTHCFSISPESIHEPILDNEEQLKRGGKIDLRGEAGTGIVFNIGALHTATTRPTNRERKTAQIYYGFADRPYLSEDSVIPAELWGENADRAARRFYGNLNAKTRDFYALPPQERTLEALRRLDVKYGRRR